MKLIKRILLLVITLGSTAVAAPPDAKPRLGISLAGPADWATELPFVDVFRTSRTKLASTWWRSSRTAIWSLV